MWSSLFKPMLQLKISHGLYFVKKKFSQMIFFALIPEVKAHLHLKSILCVHFIPVFAPFLIAYSYRPME